MVAPTVKADADDQMGDLQTLFFKKRVHKEKEINLFCA